MQPPQVCTALLPRRSRMQSGTGAQTRTEAAALLLSLLVVHSLIGSRGPVLAKNPVITYRYSADPAAHVWPTDPERVYIYASHDQDDAVNHGSMDQYYVYSSTDMVNWEDHGMVLHLDNVTWASANMWAPDAAYRNGTYFLVFCALEAATGMFRTGLAVSDRPEGPFEDHGFIDGVEWGQDPALYIDDDGEAYLYWGIGGDARAARLTPDLRSVVPGSLVELTAQLPFFYEGPWMHKRDGLYYLSYPTIYDMGEGERLEYATAKHPLGPFTPRGVIMDLTTAWTNHGSIVKFREQWYLFYHNDVLSGGEDHRRSTAVEYLHYDDHGLIMPIEPTEQGVDYSDPTAPPASSAELEDEDAARLERLQQLAAEQVAKGGRVAWRMPGSSSSSSMGDADEAEGPGVHHVLECQLCSRVLLSISYIFQPFFGNQQVPIDTYRHRHS